jgi:hypothetical protein
MTDFFNDGAIGTLLAILSPGWARTPSIVIRSSGFTRIIAVIRLLPATEI